MNRCTCVSCRYNACIYIDTFVRHNRFYLYVDNLKLACNLSASWQLMFENKIMNDDARWELKQQKAKEKRKATWVLNANVFKHTYTHSQKCHAKCLMFGKRKQCCKSPRTGAKTMWLDGNNLSNICFDNDSNIPQQHRPIRCLCWIWVLVSIRHSGNTRVNLAGYGDEF